ncbi:hypothetical protein BC629DRAFT_1442360 [Irpex lacteus]|nr:hypothetical protein BC629DRAFT_1442360 [Irpex lacteus]
MSVVKRIRPQSSNNLEHFTSVVKRIQLNQHATAACLPSHLPHIRTEAATNGARMISMLSRPADFETCNCYPAESDPSRATIRDLGKLFFAGGKFQGLRNEDDMDSLDGEKSFFNTGGSMTGS